MKTVHVYGHTDHQFRRLTWDDHEVAPGWESGQMVCVTIS